VNSNQVFNAVEAIAKTPGKNDKLALLETYMKEPAFESVMVLAYDPFVTFGIRPKRTTFESESGLFNEATFILLQALAERALTGDAAAKAVNYELARLEPGSSELLWRIINKDLKAGFSESSINKAKKGTIPEFAYMRCSLPKDTNLAEWPWATGVFSQIKADGMFFNGNVEPVAVNMCSRQGQPFPPAPYSELSDQLQFLHSHIGAPGTFYEKGSQFHGELLVEDPDGNILSRKVGNGLLNKINQGAEVPAGHRIIAVIWDVVPIANTVKKGKFDQQYLHRLKLLTSAIGFLKASGAKLLINVIETKVVRSYDEAMEHYEDARRRKLEGTVAKKPTMIWKDGTSKDQVKLKQEVPVELEVYGFEEGKEGAKTALTFGSLKCRTKCHKLKVDVGTGFSDDLRKSINDNREAWIGRIITVKSNEIMYAARGKLEHSLFLPVYEELRLDKAEADTFEQVEYQFENAVK
jgi:DNA ligase-1